MATLRCQLVEEGMARLHDKRKPRFTSSLARAGDIRRTDIDAEQAAAPSDEIAGTTILLPFLP